jgi:hypothetical protein
MILHLKIVLTCFLITLHKTLETSCSNACRSSFLLRFCLVTCTIEDASSIHANLHIVVSQKQLGYQCCVCIHENDSECTYYLFKMEHLTEIRACPFDFALLGFHILKYNGFN